MAKEKERAKERERERALRGHSGALSEGGQGGAHLDNERQGEAGAEGARRIVVEPRAGRACGHG